MNITCQLLGLTPQEFVLFLREQSISRFCFIFDRESGKVLSSHSCLQPLADFIGSDTRDFMEHEGAFFQISKEHDTLQGAFVHRTHRGQAAGGVRYWQYDDVEGYLRDGMRLAKGMTRKNALAGLWWGGGKGVMAHNPGVDKHDPAIRASIYREYGELLSSIKGCYVTAEDVGTSVEDMANVYARTRFTTCIPHDLGGSGNPSVPTARGVACGMEAALESLGLGSLEGKTVAVQGMGHVGEPLIRILLEKKVERVIACDIDPELVAEVQTALSSTVLEASAVSLTDQSILATECDILAPCATGAILNPTTIPTIRARIVCGASNNQLEDAARDDLALYERGVVYVPDFLTNRMGIVNCANEQYGHVQNDSFFERHMSRDWEHSIFQATLRVLEESRRTEVPPAQMAMRMADELSLVPHPIFGHRGQEIIDSLRADNWGR